MSSSGGLVQVLAPPSMRARVMSVWLVLGFGVQPVAYLMVGFTGQLLGAPRAVLLNGLAMAVASATLLMLRPGLRAWQPARPGG